MLWLCNAGEGFTLAPCGARVKPHFAQCFKVSCVLWTGPGHRLYADSSLHCCIMAMPAFSSGCAGLRPLLHGWQDQCSKLLRALLQML